MGAITGCLALQAGDKPDEDWVRTATRRIAHRGPGDDGFYAGPQVALGCARLALTATRQPACSADGRYRMVYDGEIYNHAELAQALRARGARLRSGTDTEVLIETFALLGRDVVRKLRGMYAFAIWDSRSQALFCARDPFGIKPFYYAVSGHGAGGLPAFRFASERKALAGPGKLTELDPDALRRYLAFQYVPGPATSTPPLRSLPPGHAMIVRPGRPLNVYRYWSASLRPADGPSAETPPRILDVMRDSVAAHARVGAPLGVFLSGGVDSAAVCALAAQQRPGLPAFTVGFGSAGHDDIRAARETAAALGVRSVTRLVSAEEFFAELPRIVWHLDDPMADPAAAALWFAAREASRHVKVVLSGDGADELFGGYPAYREPGLVRVGGRLPDWGRSPLRRAAAILPPGARGRGLLERASTPLRRRYIGNEHAFGVGEADLLAGPGRASAFDVTDPVYDQAAAAGLDDVCAMQLVDINTRLAGDICVRADRMTAAHGLEVRAPFLDREVMAVASRLSREEKTAGGGITKFALREAMGEVLPPAAAERPNRGFVVPVGDWLAGQWSGFAHDLLRSAQTDRWISRAAAVGLLRRYRAGEPGVTWRQVWVLVVFALWHQIYVERVYDPVALGWQAPPGRQPVSRPRG